MHTSTDRSPLFHKQTVVFLAFVLFLSFLTYFFRYTEPPRVFWDENYHIASAQKYLNGVYFMEQHPPLGKLLIALGEKLLSPNERTDQFLGTDYAADFSDDFSFAGYRLFSALLGWLTAPLLFLIFLYITRNSLFAALLSFLYIFDNALLVHIRGAMLEGPLMFFCALMVLAYFLLLEYGERPRRFAWLSLLFGVSFGLVATTKLFGLAMILFLPAYLYTLLPHWKRIAKATALFSVGFLAVYCSVWYIHFALGKTIQPTLPDNGFYQASDAYKTVIAEGRTASLLAFPVMLRDSIRYVPFYNRGAPRLDLCKADENGSPFYLWPLGARSINYRWETPDGTEYRYLYLQSNP
ncbi:MAG: phospholipid carrier-dependent glycosyltransferase, partial [Candidatus Peribacteraceae bacterium]|nr:phospholipid carrier-dependent glycosyltransferase [Candidatus Peribacteraceae bacterium]